MPLSLESIRTSPKRSEFLDLVLGVLSDAGFELTDWNEGSIQRTFLESTSAVGSDVADIVTQIANFCFNRYATGAGLREYSRSSYDNEPQAAQKTQGPATLTSTAASGYTIEVGQLISSTDNDVDFTNTTGGVLTAGGTLILQWQAVLAGAAGNVPNNAIKRLKTPLAGVTVLNPPGGSGIWYTTSGSDPEPSAKLRDRNHTKWATLNQISMPSDGYRNLALQVPAVTRVYVDDLNPRGPNTLDVYLATASGPATSTEIDAAQALFDLKRSPDARPLALAPTPLEVSIVGTVHIQRGLNTTTKQTEVREAIDDFLLGVPIGGVVLPPATNGVLPYSELLTAVGQIRGVVGFRPTSLLTDLALLANQIVVPGLHTLSFISA